MDRDSELSRDAEDAVRLVAGLLRRGETGEAFRERRRTVSWTASEAGLLTPSASEERGTAVRIRRHRQFLLTARHGDGPESLREVVREAARRTGNAPFFKARRPPERRAAQLPAEDAGEEERTAALASALARAFPDPRGLTVSLTVSRVVVTRAVVTPRAFLSCGTGTHLYASGRVRRGGSERSFAFQSRRPWSAAVDSLALALREACKPRPPLVPSPGATDVVLSSSAAAAFWHEVVGHPLEADGSERGSVLARVRGAAVAPPGLDVVDDPGRSDLPGGYAVDDEGTVARAVALLRDGAVASLLTDRRSGGQESNGHGRVSDFRRPPRARLSNLVASPGHSSLDELLDRCGTGVYVRQVLGGSADPESGRFVLLVDSAEAIRKGRRGAPLASFALTGEVLAALSAIEPDWGFEALPASGLALCVKGGDPLPVGGAAPALLVRGLHVRAVRP